MYKRIMEFPEMHEASENCVSNLNNSYSEVSIPSCINDDYCVSAPRDMNDGILTMAFVDMQPLDSVYPPEKALNSGTLFPNIDKPFYGGRRR